MPASSISPAPTDSADDERVSGVSSDKPPPASYPSNAYSKFMDGAGMTREDTDGIMNTIALINALILTIPYSLSASLDNSYWDWLLDLFNLPVCAEHVKSKCPDSPSKCWEEVYNLYQNNLYITVYASITALGVCFLYYLMRPTCVVDDDEKKGKRTVVYVHYIYTNNVEGLEMADRKILQSTHKESDVTEDKQEKSDPFLKWWLKGRFVILIVVVATFISVVTVLNLFAITANRYVTGTNRYCVKSTRGLVAITGGVVTFLLSLIASFYFMF